ncbi:MAG: hypothetical protein ACI4AA_10725 [Lachnospiraceae bacterium]
MILVVLLTVCVMPFRVKAQGVTDHAAAKTVFNTVSENDVPDSDPADMEELEDEVVTGEDGQYLLLDEDLHNGLVAFVNFQYKYTLVQTVLLAMILSALVVYAVFDHFVR